MKEKYITLDYYEYLKLMDKIEELKTLCNDLYRIALNFDSEKIQQEFQERMERNCTRNKQ